MPKKTSRKLPIYEYDEKVNGQVRYYIRPYVNGKQKTIRLDDNGNMWLGRDGYNEACDYIANIENKIANVQYDPNMPFSKVIEKTIESEKNKIKFNTYRNLKNDVKNHILPFFKNYRLKDLNNQVFLEWHKYIESKNLSVSTRNKSHLWLCKICDYGVNYYSITYNFEKNIGNFKRTTEEKEKITDKNHIRYITLDQFNEFISNVDDILWNMFFTFLFYTGMRKGEVLALKWEDINFENKIISVTKTLSREIVDGKKKSTSTKTGEIRDVDISDILFEKLKDYYNYCKPLKDYYVFGGEKPLALSTIDRKKHYYFSLCNVSEITLHEFRHSHVSMLANEAVKNNIEMGSFFVIMSKRMGHTIEVMQRTYMHLFPDIQKPIIDLLNNI